MKCAFELQFSKMYSSRNKIEIPLFNVFPGLNEGWLSPGNFTRFVSNDQNNIASEEGERHIVVVHSWLEAALSNDSVVNQQLVVKLLGEMGVDDENVLCRFPVSRFTKCIILNCRYPFRMYAVVEVN